MEIRPPLLSLTTHLCISSGCCLPCLAHLGVLRDEPPHALLGLLQRHTSSVDSEAGLGHLLPNCAHRCDRGLAISGEPVHAEGQGMHEMMTVNQNTSSNNTYTLVADECCCLSAAKRCALASSTLCRRVRRSETLRSPRRQVRKAACIVPLSVTRAPRAPLHKEDTRLALASPRSRSEAA